MAIGAVLIGGVLGFLSFWLALFGLGYGFFASLGVYASVGTVSSLMLMARAWQLPEQSNHNDHPADQFTVKSSPVFNPNTEVHVVARSSQMHDTRDSVL